MKAGPGPGLPHYLRNREAARSGPDRLGSALVTPTPHEGEIAPKIADRRAVLRNVGIFVRGLRVGQGVPGMIRERRKLPVSLDEFRDRDVIGIFMRNVSALRIFRHDEERDARSVAEIVDRLDVTGVVVAAALVDGDQDRGGLP